MNEQTKASLREAYVVRQRGYVDYQINIDNFRLAIAKIDVQYAGDAAMQEFRARLVELLDQHIIEQKKEQIMMEVIRDQLEAANALP